MTPETPRRKYLNMMNLCIRGCGAERVQYYGSDFVPLAVSYKASRPAMTFNRYVANDVGIYDVAIVSEFMEFSADIEADLIGIFTRLQDRTNGRISVAFFSIRTTPGPFKMANGMVKDAVNALPKEQWDSKLHKYKRQNLLIITSYNE